MTTDFAAKLAEYGFGPDTDFYETTTAFFHEIHNLHHDEDNPSTTHPNSELSTQPSSELTFPQRQS